MNDNVFYRLPRDAQRFVLDAVFNLPSYKWYQYTAELGRYFGPDTERYANETHLYWKNGSVVPATKTKERLIRIAPKYLETSQKIKLVELIAKPYISSMYLSYGQEHIRFLVTEPLEPQLQTAQNKIAQFLRPQTARMPELPSDFKRTLVWLYDNEATATQAILSIVEAEKKNQLDEQLKTRIPGILNQMVAFYNDPDKYGEFRTTLKFSNGSLTFRIYRDEPSHFWYYVIGIVLLFLILSSF